MARYLGLDYGTKRIGIALSDDGEKIAFPRDVVSSEWKTFFAFVINLVKVEHVRGIVVGLAKGFNGKETEMTKEIYRFAQKLERELALPVYLQNEVLSTKAVLRGPTKKEKIDAASAALILQSYLDRKNMIQ